MRKYAFLFKENDSNDRDCVAYVDIKDLKQKHTDIIGKFNIHGACYSKSFKAEANYNDVTTILTEEEYYSLSNGLNDCLDIIIEKLESEENQELFEEVIQEEIEYLKDEYDLDNKDIEQIFNEYYLGYRDRSIVGCVFDNVEDLSYEEAEQLGYVTKENDRYFNYEKFGEDLLGSEDYIELRDGRIVSLCY